MKGLALNHLKRSNEAIIYFEQAITVNTSKYGTIQSIQDISLIKIRQKDIYSAYYTLDRLESVPESLKFLEFFLNGAVSIIKKKYPEGISLMKKLKDAITEANIDSDTKKELGNLRYSYKAYAYFSSGKIQEAFKAYSLLKDGNVITKGDRYNFELCSGIIKTQENNFFEAESHFKKASKMGFSKVEPRFYLGFLAIIKFIYKERQAFTEFLRDQYNENKFQEFRRKLILEVYSALEILEQILAENDSCSNLSFYIGYLKLTLGLENEAVENFNFAMEKSDDNHAHHFHWKGIALAMNNVYEEALNEFRVSLSIDPNYFPGALYAGRCYLYNRDIERGFNVFKEFMDGGEREAELKFWIANFFFVNNLNNHAEQFYSESLDIDKREDTIKQLYKCYIVEKDLIKALNKLKLLKLTFPDPEYDYDYIMLEALKKTSACSFEPAFNDLKVRLQCEIENGFVFQKYDLLFYIGFNLFYLDRIEECLSYFERAKEEKYGVHPPTYYHDEDTLEQMFLLDSSSYNEEDNKDPSFGQAFTYAEILYNISLCLIKLGKRSEALKLLDEVASLHIKIEEPSLLLLKVLNQKNENENQQEHEEAVKKIFEVINQANQPDEEEEEVEEEEKGFSIFPFKRRLCGIYQPTIIKIKDVLVPVRLSFCLPYVSPPDLGIKVGFEILKEIKITSVENQPEAPWIKRESEHIMFTNQITTDEIQEVDDINQLMLHMDANNTHHVLNTAVKQKAKIIFQKREEEEQKLKSKSIFSNPSQARNTRAYSITSNWTTKQNRG